jgi:hypothetical protein
MLHKLVPEQMLFLFQSKTSTPNTARLKLNPDK